jgi:hypothetical protein
MVKPEFVGRAITAQKFQAIEEVTVLKCVVVRETLLDQLTRLARSIDQSSHSNSKGQIPPAST